MNLVRVLKMKIIIVFVLASFIIGIMILPISSISDEFFNTQPMVAIDGNDVFGLKADGTVVLGVREYKSTRDYQSISEWTEIVKISANWGTIAGLKQDGTVVLAGRFSRGDEFQLCTVGWTDIIDVSVFCGTVVGLKSDGTVVYTSLFLGDITQIMLSLLDSWQDIAKLGKGHYPCAIKNDGTAVTYHLFSQASLQYLEGFEITALVSAEWTVYNSNRPQALTSTGKILTPSRFFTDVDEWEDVVDFNAVEYADYLSPFTVALKSNGEMVSHGYVEYVCVCGYYDCHNYSTLSHPVNEWTDIIQFDLTRSHIGPIVVGLKKDGSVVISHDTGDEWLKEVATWNLFNVGGMPQLSVGECLQGLFSQEDVTKISAKVDLRIGSKSRLVSGEEVVITDLSELTVNVSQIVAPTGNVNEFASEVVEFLMSKG